MSDLAFVFIFVAFTVLCVAYISWCDRIIGADDQDSAVVAVDPGAKDSVTL